MRENSPAPAWFQNAEIRVGAGSTSGSEWAQNSDWNRYGGEKATRTSSRLVVRATDLLEAHRYRCYDGGSRPPPALRAGGPRIAAPAATA